MSFESMPFGKYRGRPLTEVPEDYLCWAAGVAQLKGLRDAIKQELGRRARERAQARDRAWEERERAKRARRARAERERPRHGGAIIPPALRPMAQRIVQAGFRRVAHEAHPDHGGTEATMREALEAKAALEQVVA